jgi:hypothetical protein
MRGGSVLLSFGAALRNCQRTDDLLIVDNFGAHPSAIGKESKENDGEEVPLLHKKLGLNAPNYQSCAESRNCSHQAFQYRYVENILVHQILTAIEEGEYRETNGQQGSANSLNPMGGLTIYACEVGKEASQRQNESAEDRTAEHNDAFMQLSEQNRGIGTLVQQFAFLQLKETQ